MASFHDNMSFTLDFHLFPMLFYKIYERCLVDKPILVNLITSILDTINYIQSIQFIIKPQNKDNVFILLASFPTAISHQPTTCVNYIYVIQNQQ